MKLELAEAVVSTHFRTVRPNVFVCEHCRRTSRVDQYMITHQAGCIVMKAYQIIRDNTKWPEMVFGDIFTYNNTEYLFISLDAKEVKSFVVSELKNDPCVTCYTFPLKGAAHLVNIK